MSLKRLNKLTQSVSKCLIDQIASVSAGDGAGIRTKMEILMCVPPLNREYTLNL